jgi:NADPH-dependent 2,4-dienoyl-CoA reductase/sulfur reductase-like enzyme
MSTPHTASSALAFDLVVIGAGPAGMAAADYGVRHGLKTLLLDEQPEVGGQIYRSILSTDGRRETILGPDYSHGRTLAKRVAEHAAAGRLTYWPETAVWQVDTDRTLHVLREGRSKAIQGQAVILATGAMERPFPVPGWTLPGVMTAGAGQILLKSASLVPSEPVVLAGCGPLLYLLTVQYLRAGVKIKAILDTTAGEDWKLAWRHGRSILKGWKYAHKGMSLLREIKNAHVPFFRGIENLRLEGGDTLERVRYTCDGRDYSLDTRLCLLHQGVVPNTQITWSIRAEHRWDDAQLCWVPVVNDWCELSVPGFHVAGDGASIGGALVAALQGELAALGAIRNLRPAAHQTVAGEADRLRREIENHYAIRSFLNAQYRPRDEFRIPADETIVCRCEEVTAGEIRKQAALGCTGPNQTKSFSRCGMGPCQGRMCGLTVTEVIAQATRQPPDDVGYYRIRPPIRALTLGQLAQLDP